MKHLYFYFIFLSLFPFIPLSTACLHTPCVCDNLGDTQVWSKMGRCPEAPGIEAVPGRPGVGPLRQQLILNSRKIQAVERPRVINCPSSTQL